VALRDAYRVLVGKPMLKRPLGMPRIILKWNFKEVGWMAWTRLKWFRTERGGGLL
jgi:hypothetical protein